MEHTESQANGTNNLRDGLHLREGPSGQEQVTLVIHHRVHPSHTESYEAWLRKIVPIAAQSRGHRGVNVIRPTAGQSEYTIILHFETVADLDAWLQSSTRKELITEVLPLLADGDQVEIKTGLEFWFTPAGHRMAKPYKQFLVTLSVIFPLTLIVPWVLSYIYDQSVLFQSPIVRQFFNAAAIVASLTYIIMPRYTRLLAKWLYK